MQLRQVEFSALQEEQKEVLLELGPISPPAASRWKAEVASVEEAERNDEAGRSLEVAGNLPPLGIGVFGLGPRARRYPRRGNSC